MYDQGQKRDVYISLCKIIILPKIKKLPTWLLAI
jgi:hypothetical protein